MLDRVRARWNERYRAARIRETRYLMSFNMSKVNGWLFILLSVFIALNFSDALTTLVAMKASPTFVELNPIASGLFELNFVGFTIALALKYIPIVPLVFATFLKDSGRTPISFRVVKVSALVALAAADLFYLVVVGSNLSTLAHYFLA